MEPGSRGGSAGAEGGHDLAATFAYAIEDLQVAKILETQDGGGPMSPEKVCLHFPHFMQLVRPLCLCDLLVGLFVDSRCRCERRLHRACRVHAHPCVLTDHRVQDPTRSLPRPVDKGIYLGFCCNARRARSPEGHWKRGSAWRNAGRYACVCVHAWAFLNGVFPPLLVRCFMSGLCRLDPSSVD